MEIKELDKSDYKWLRTYGHIANNIDEYSKIIEYLKEFHFYEYLYYVDLDIKNEAEKIFENETRDRKWYKSFNRRYRQERKRLIKEKYGLEKKGIL